MDIVESDLKQLFMWTKLQDDSINSLQELCKSQQVLIEVQDERVSNIEHDLALVLSVIKDRKDST
ncbi:MAG TPA: hypothetical protein EYN67_06860 [Flavobacteriales bacterium]|nr:hypothetical protein [Flavobacteriales bacterium]